MRAALFRKQHEGGCLAHFCIRVLLVGKSKMELCAPTGNIFNHQHTEVHYYSRHQVLFFLTQWSSVEQHWPFIQPPQYHTPYQQCVLDVTHCSEHCSDS